MAGKSTYHHGDLRQALIDGAIALLSERVDVNRLSLREVARRVGVSHAAPYRHFQDKEALLAAVAEQGFRQLTAAMNQRIQAAPDDPLAQLEATGVGYVQFAIAHPAHYRLMFGQFLAEQLPHPERQQAAEAGFRVLLNRIEVGQTAGVVRSGDARQLAWVAWSTVHGLAMLLIDGRLPTFGAHVGAQNVEALAQFVTHTLTEGLAP